MKAALKICNMKTMVDVNKIRNGISNNEGVIACQINLENKEVNVVYDEYFLSLDNILESVEDLGYTIL
ncbi:MULTISPECIES: heavy-metal-associated domain-containing protein [unclassified Clostridium]|uniref:heavy-metal-associated domain-containing protein n=1 Tax=unclassified Clostridium TaxID=2614128 RepID=UPI00052E01A3|nr:MULTISPECIES: heavy-metal-associated domain-containing protein [unclassified Clostridium]KGK90627.1 ferredoxin [Clostridium sp. HMP27]